MLLDEVEVLSDSSILRQDSDRPAGLGENRFEAPASDVVLLGFRRPGVSERAELDEAAVLDLCGIPCDPVGRVGVNDGVAVAEGVLAHGLEGRMRAQDSAGAAVQAVVPALQAAVHSEGGEALSLELRRVGDACLEVVFVVSHRGLLRSRVRRREHRLLSALVLDHVARQTAWHGSAL